MSEIRKEKPAVRGFGKFGFDWKEPVVLPNGINMYVVDGSDQAVNRVDVIFRGGMFEEEKRLQSLATVSMLQHGSSKYPSGQIAECFDFNGSWLGTRNSERHTVVSLNSLNRCFDVTLSVLHDMVYNPQFPSKEFEIYRNRCISAYRTARERVKYLANVEMDKIFFGEDYPITQEVRDEDIMGLGIEDLRCFHDKYFIPDNCSIVLSGQITERELALMTNTFGTDKTPEGAARAQFVEVCQKPSSRHFSAIDKPDAVQSAVLMRMHAIPRSHPDYFKLRTLIVALGGYFGSRLMSNIREEKGYTYGIWASLLGTRAGAYVNISTECDTAYTVPLINEVKNEISRLKEEPIPEEELDMVKSFILSDLVKTLDTPFAMGGYVNTVLLYGVYPEYFNNHVEAVRNMSSDELLDTARKYLDFDNFYTVIAGNLRHIKINSI